MAVVTAPSATGPAAVSTWVITWGASASQLSGKCTLEPIHEVVPFLAYRASRSCGELIIRADGGSPAVAVRQRMPSGLR
jgi:hypothetical protein